MFIVKCRKSKSKTSSNEQATTCHDFHGFEWKNINIFKILTHFVYSSTPFSVCYILNTPKYKIYMESISSVKIQIMIIHMVVVFSHSYVIMHEYFGKKTKNGKNEYISFYRQFDMFSCMIISCTCDLNLGP